MSQADKAVRKGEAAAALLAAVLVARKAVTAARKSAKFEAAARKAAMAEAAVAEVLAHNVANSVRPSVCVRWVFWQVVGRGTSANESVLIIAAAQARTASVAWAAADAITELAPARSTLMPLLK